MYVDFYGCNGRQRGSAEFLPNSLDLRFRIGLSVQTVQLEFTVHCTLYIILSLWVDSTLFKIFILNEMVGVCPPQAGCCWMLVTILLLLSGTHKHSQYVEAIFRQTAQQGRPFLRVSPLVHIVAQIPVVDWPTH